MNPTWIQFTLLMLAIIGFALRNEHRITLVEGEIKAQKQVSTLMWKRIDKLEDKNK